MKQWLTDDANFAYYNQLKKVWDESQQLASVTTVDENEAWLKFQRRINPAHDRRARFGWMRVAAALVTAPNVEVTRMVNWSPFSDCEVGGVV